MILPVSSGELHLLEVLITKEMLTVKKEDNYMVVLTDLLGRVKKLLLKAPTSKSGGGNSG